MSKRFFKQLAVRNRLERMAAFKESLAKKKEIVVKPERKYFISGDSDGGYWPEHINLNRYICDTYFYTENDEIAGGTVKIVINGKRHHFGRLFPDWDFEALKKESVEVTKEEWNEFLGDL